MQLSDFIDVDWEPQRTYTQQCPDVLCGTLSRTPFCSDIIQSICAPMEHAKITLIIKSFIRMRFGVFVSRWSVRQSRSSLDIQYSELFPSASSTNYIRNPHQRHQYKFKQHWKAGRRSLTKMASIWIAWGRANLPPPDISTTLRDPFNKGVW